MLRKDQSRRFWPLTLYFFVLLGAKLERDQSSPTSITAPTHNLTHRSPLVSAFMHRILLLQPPKAALDSY